MINLTLSEISSIVSGQLIGKECEITHVTTDTRAITQGSLFIALIGERFDAHDFAQQALDNGAVAMIVQRPVDVEVAQILVTDTKLALGALGAEVHRRCDSKTIAITGSCGKTTVKEMVAAILGQQANVLYTDGNFNNDIGVPLTLLRNQPSDDYSVIELGANHIGEIAYTTQLTRPDIALVNNVAEAHLEGFGSLDGVKQAKGEIYQGLSSDGIAIVNLDSQGEGYWQPVLADKQVTTISATHCEADFYASDITLSSEATSSFTLHTPLGTSHVELSLLGSHNVVNAIAASAIAYHCGIELSQIQTGLQSLSKVKRRVEVEKLTQQITLIDDSYNASVPAMKAAVDLLSSFTDERWLILGNMAELGHESLALHSEVGQHAAPFAFEHVLTFGDDARVISEICGGQHFADHDSMFAYIVKTLEQLNQTPHTMLVKGALSAGMYTIAKALKENYS
ncbi:UDP-N-acetylmuramoyl-tripeptide--D-alanyl-D-alanine ligase [Vibrio hippocampi]|uniref:UDP-N-acetylmuramoyl-tripeptide--D-alanyl-D-alanine ligase n=1 Tax=Vibrio hippocampi TaxID=654686 RepID=A0ABN8DI27_9VIBR|nr:UDP-N-acetylmuramoyl-tripeptide--D-alanyl-D-alanine ligase [Vibrio hippocampi]CAH0527082.1 UDP-N-acetylmuramoyl-tripeptide--D-alanyl-D-alanine ligase [Vibrio hippocampi]